MTKRKISKKQAWVQKKIQEERIARAQKKDAQLDAELQNTQLGPEQEGLLISHFGTQAEVEQSSGESIRCKIRQHLGVLVAGDIVIWRRIDDEHGVIVARKERRSVLGRPDRLGDIKPIAANLDQMIIVSAPQPRIVSRLIDSYLVAAEHLGLSPLILLNKVDMLDEVVKQDVQDTMAIYAKLPYPLVHTSIYDEAAMLTLAEHLRDKVSVFVGQSGVGKSSLINALLPHEQLRVGELKQGIHGSHTTSNSRFYHLPAGGALIDSPGIRDFGLWQMNQQQIAGAYVEFQPFLGQCQFRNCQHRNEPNCALRAAAERGDIHATRLQNFLSLLED